MFASVLVNATKTMWQSVGLTVLVIVATLVCALLFMLFGKLAVNIADMMPDLC